MHSRYPQLGQNYDFFWWIQSLWKQQHCDNSTSLDTKHNNNIFFILRSVILMLVLRTFDFENSISTFVLIEL